MCIRMIRPLKQSSRYEFSPCITRSTKMEMILNVRRIVDGFCQGVSELSRRDSQKSRNLVSIRKEALDHLR
jgi:hypothetical protein